MTFDINKPFTRRDGKEVLWHHQIAYGRIYGFEDDFGDIRAVRVNHSGDTVDEKGRNLINPGAGLINTPEYEWRNEYESGTSTQFRGSKAMTDLVSISYLKRVGYARRPAGSTNITEWELLPLDTELE